MLQVICLKAVRDMESGKLAETGGAAIEDQLDTTAKQLLMRAPDAANRPPYRAAIEDTLIITMKGISAGMQNTG